MNVTRGDAAFLLRRAEEEAVRALTSQEPEAEAAHHELALLYSQRARRALADADAAAWLEEHRARGSARS